MSNFDEATRATEEMFDNQLDSGAVAEENTEEITEEDSVEESPNETITEENTSETTAEQIAQEAAQTAEIAAQTAAEKDGQLQQVMAELEAVKRQNEQLQGTIDALSNRNETEVVEETLSPPVLDINGLAFADEATQQKALADYAANMAAYNREQIMKELSPFVEQAKEGTYIKERDSLADALSRAPEFSGIKEMMPQIERIIKNTPALSAENVPLDEKIIAAFAIAKGVNSMNNPPEPPKELTTEELFEKYKNDPALQEMIEKQRIEQLKGSQQVPPFSASSGAVNAALNIKEKPQTFDEASRRTREMFGLD